MREITPLPTHGAVFFDERDHGRSMRVSFHPGDGVFVISMWRYDTCLSTFRLPADTAPELISSIVGSLAAPYTVEGGRSESA